MRLGEGQILESSEAQQAFGKALAPRLERGAIVFLEGDLGAGKTTLIQGFLQGLDFVGEVNSPTYALMQHYPTPHGLVLHVDAYRVRDPFELWSMGLEEYLEEARASFLEWGESFYNSFPEAWILRLEHVAQGRKITRVR